MSLKQYMVVQGVGSLSLPPAPYLFSPPLQFPCVHLNSGVQTGEQKNGSWSPALTTIPRTINNCSNLTARIIKNEQIPLSNPKFPLYHWSSWTNSLRQQKLEG